MRGKRSKNKIVYVEARGLKVHPSAQRKLVPAQVKKIMACLDLDAIGTLHVVNVQGQYWIIDGQHRWWALMNHGLGEWEVRCEVHVDVTDQAGASQKFLTLNNKATVAPFDKFVNEVDAGDPVAVGAANVTKRHGLKIDRQATDGNVAAVTAIKKIWALDDGATLSETYETLIEAQGRTASAMEGKVIEGVAMVLSRFNGELDRATLIKKIAKYPGGAAGMLGDAKGLQKIRRASLPKCVAEVLVETYNRGRREANRLPTP